MQAPARVVPACSPPSPALGHELRKFIGLTRSALIGWVPPTPGATALAWEAGEVMDYDHSTVLYVESYQLTHLLQK